MKITGIICEYNPFHNGHARQLAQVRALAGSDSGIVCLMSGDYVQRGEPAMIDKLARARAAIQSGADLVLELPTVYALSSAEGFAAGGVSILAPFCDHLCFGAETADTVALTGIARALLSQDFPPALREFLDQGLSFPAARQRALSKMGLDGALLATPNNILAVEYCKAMLSTAMQPMVIHRPGSYHDPVANRENPSATALRSLLLAGGDIREFTPADFQGLPLHTLAAGERAILARLRTMQDAEFEALPHGSEGLWRKLMHASRECATLNELLEAVKSKRYTYTRISRMVLCAFLGLTAEDLQRKAPYARVLALNDRGREILKKARQTGLFPNIAEAVESPYWLLEQRCGSLYGLFAQDAPEPPTLEKDRRVFYARMP